MNRAGWHRALDMQMDTHKWCLSEFGMRYNLGIFGSLLSTGEDGEHFANEPDSDSVVTLAAQLTQTMYRADTIFITSDMLHVCMQAAHELPDNVEFDVHTLITPMGFCLFEEPLEGKDRMGKHMLVHAIAWNTAMIAAARLGDDPVQCILLYFMVDPQDKGDDYNAAYLEIHKEHDVPIPPLVLSHMYPAIIGHTVPHHMVGKPGADLIVEISKLFLAMQLLAQQRIGEVQQVPAPRAARKRYARDWGPNAPQKLISLITLRRKKGPVNPDPSPVPWSRRWIVKGHWRRQWYESIKKHEWIYIAEFIKGPEDKPLIITERRVFNFKR